MKKKLLAWALAPCFLLAIVWPMPAVLAEEAQLSEEELKTLRNMLQERGQFQGGMTQVPPPSGELQPSEKKRLSELSKPRDVGGKYDSTMEGSGKLIYARPFVASPKAIVGGYVDFEYINKANDGTPQNFDVHRLVPFIYADVSEHVKFATEIEFEHGAQSSSGGTDIKVEFATVDYLINDPLNLRGGILLLPLGKFNLLHDSPLRDLTERPIVAQRIIPTTLHQPGVGSYGTFYPTRLSQLNYEAYVTTGFTNAYGGPANANNQGGTCAAPCSNITNTNGNRSARSNSTSFNNNNSLAFVGRLAFSPILGVEIGGSGFWGNYDPRSARPLSILAVDWTLQRGPFELIGESAWGYARDNHKDINDNYINDQRHARRQTGYYIQGNYHFLPPFLTRLAPTHFRPEVSTFTAVVRWEAGNLGQDLPDTEIGQLGAYQRATFGLNFRPTEDTVFKFDYQYSPETRRGDERIHDHGFLAQVATYF